MVLHVEPLVFYFSKINLKSECCLFLMVSLLNSQPMESCKSRESFCISILTIYTNDQLLDMFTGAMFIFSFVRFVNMCEPRTGWPTSIGILWKWASESAKLAGDGECRLTRFQLIRNFLANKIYLFQGCPMKQAVFLPGQPAPYNQLFIQPLLLVPECYSA